MKTIGAQRRSAGGVEKPEPDSWVKQEPQQLQGNSEGSIMKTFLLSAAFATTVGLTGLPANPAAAAVGDLLFFNLTVSPGAAACLPNARGRAVASNVGPVENLHVEV